VTDIQSAKSTIPFKELPSHEDFRPPSRIETDFQRLLDHRVPHVNWTFELIHNWYYVSTQTAESLEKLTNLQLRRMYEGGCRIIRIHYENIGGTENIYYALKKDGTYTETDQYEPEYIRGQQTSIDWKSKIAGSDMSTNFKTDYTHKINKGDYVIREDGMLYMLNWNVTLHANNQATQSVECNAIVDITRYFPDETDDKGILICSGGRRPVAAGIPINHAEYAGRPDYSGASGQAGMHPDHLITVYCQWNPTTRKIRLDDEFIIGDFTYRVVNVSLAEVQIDKDYGILTLNAKRVAGGSVDGNE
jgi:hypothetical protein